MARFVGVIPFMRVFDSSAMKRQALVFDQLAVPGAVMLTQAELLRSMVDSYDLLMEAEVIVEPGPLETAHLTLIGTRYKDDPYMKLIRELQKRAEPKGEIAAELKARGIKTSDEMVEMFQMFMKASLMSEYLLRPISAVLREQKGIDAHPVFTVKPHYLLDSAASKNDVLDIVVNALPLPDENVSWQQIIEYRKDPATASKFAALRNWMNEVARANLPANEIEDKLQWLLQTYQQHLRLHKLKCNMGPLETVLVTSADALENLASFKFGGAVKTLFSFKRRKIDLLEGELTAPGNEVAFIANALTNFS